MPRVLTFFAILVPVVAVFLVCRSFDVAAHLQLSWPLALHPDSPVDDAQFHVDVPSAGVESDSGVLGHGIVVAEIGDDAAKHQFRRRVVAVGDLHGDLPNAHKVLQMAGVVDETGQWSGGVDFFVQTGDIIDRGDDTIKLYDWIDQLRGEAKAKGGVVLSHLGNHEWMNVIAQERQKMLMTGRIGKTWAGNYTTTSRLPLHPSLGPPNTDYDPSLLSSLSHAAVSFVHGGLAPNYPDLTPFPSRINNLGHTLLRKLQHRNPPPAPHPPNPYPGLPHDATPAEHRLYGTDGPLWYRGWALDSEAKACKAVDDVLQRTGTRRMIMGHTPDFEV
ncbi:hypothetical protein PHLCEN_2v9064 [Hermanssonia centrifuga]|uniref:Calcineurin-like phosphoesterase domain-containing protein n=1 Tax=Hermanssonia centrifuga TaxID=98765 RepID=A0A2R6NRX1_9APHY|nr:hypothetical protein PHLCEN_2v9064 [Hermanssonia centrifuga]